MTESHAGVGSGRAEGLFVPTLPGLKSSRVA